MEIKYLENLWHNSTRTLENFKKTTESVRIIWTHTITPFMTNLEITSEPSIFVYNMRE